MNHKQRYFPQSTAQSPLPALGAQTHRRSFKMTKMAKMINMPRSNTRECSGLSGLSGALGDGRSATRRPACSRGEDWTPAEPGPHESRQPRDERPTRVHDPAPALAHAVGLADPRVAAVRRHAVASAPAPSTHPVRVGPSTRSTTDARPAADGPSRPRAARAAREEHERGSC